MLDRTGGIHAKTSKTNKSTPKRLGSVNYSTVNIFNNNMGSKRQVGTRNVSHLVDCLPAIHKPGFGSRKKGRKEEVDGGKKNLSATQVLLSGLGSLTTNFRVT